MVINKGRKENLYSTPIEWQSSAAIGSFIAARRQYFDALISGEKQLVTQGVDFLKITPLCIHYAETYRDLLLDLKNKIERGSGIDQRKIISTLRNILLLDTIRVVVIDFSGHRREGVLIGPIHPLRALWFSAWVEIANKWLNNLEKYPTEFIGPVRDALQKLEIPLKYAGRTAIARWQGVQRLG